MMKFGDRISILRLCLMLAAVLFYVYSSTAQDFHKKLTPGIVLDSIWTVKDTDESYAIYLPSDYSSKKAWPIIYIFDPLARGSFAVKMFQSAAEKHGYIIVCSNNSQNGSWDRIFKAADALFLDTFEKLYLDPSRVYTAGFSGGARAAVATAVLTGKVEGVIGCGAGFPTAKDYQPSAKDDFVYLGIVGNKDMNYSEHHDVAQYLDEIQLKNDLIIFEGIHQWPTEDVFEEALAWLTIKYSQKLIEKPSATSIDCLSTNTLARGEAFLSKGQLLLASRAFKFAVEQLGKFADVDEFNIRIDSIRRHKVYSKLLKWQKKIDAKEVKLKERYIKSFSELHISRLDTASGQKGITWWHNEVDYLKRMGNSKNHQSHHLAARMLNLIWARCAESSFSYVGRGDYEMALKLNQLWLYCQPESLWGLWSLAKIHALAGRNKASVAVLKKAVKLGLSNPNRLKSEAAFQTLKKEKEYQLLVKQMEEKNGLN